MKFCIDNAILIFYSRFSVEYEPLGQDQPAKLALYLQDQKVVGDEPPMNRQAPQEPLKNPKIFNLAKIVDCETQMLFVLDANAWLKERLLRSAVGVAFLHAVRRLDSKLLLPESTRLEILAGVQKCGDEAVRKVESGLATIQSLIGHKPDYAQPSADDFRSATELRLDELSDLIQECEITLDIYYKALMRVTDHRSPARTKEQYRDCLLWECLIEAADNCILVSADGDFLDKIKSHDKTKSSCLAQELVRESNGRVSLYLELKDALKAVEPQLPPPDLEGIADAIAAAIQPVLLNVQESQGWYSGPRVGADIELYATERVATTTVVFNLRFNAYDLCTADGQEIDEGFMEAKGECLIDDSHVVRALRLDRINLLTIYDKPLAGGAMYAYADGLAFGTRQIPYTVRAKID